jgi:DNA polymerase III epsilon subunit-like protein
MKILVFDTETTGLPKSRKPAALEANNWPHIVSISWLILDNENMYAITKQKNYIIKPMGWDIPMDSVLIHGITTEIANEKGVSLKDVMDEFLAEKPTHLVAHNLNFDYNVLVNAIKWDLGNTNFGGFNIPNFCCSMINSRVNCKLRSKKSKSFKPPKLRELYEYIFERSPDPRKLHGSLYDCTILAECIQHSDWLRKELDLVDSIV